MRLLRITLLIISIFTLGCVGHKDLAQANADMFDVMQEQELLHKKEVFLQSMLNRYFTQVRMVSGGKLNGYCSRVEITDVTGAHHSGTATIAVYIAGQDKNWRIITRKFIAEADDNMFHLGQAGFDKPVFE